MLNLFNFNAKNYAMQPSEGCNLMDLSRASHSVCLIALQILSDITSLRLLRFESPPISKNGGQRIPPTCDDEYNTWLFNANTTIELN